MKANMIFSLCAVLLTLISTAHADTSIETKQKKHFLGKWKTSNGKSYVEFFPGDTCAKGFIEGGHWKIMKNKSEIYYKGRSIKCGEGSGMMEREAPNKLIEDYGMGGDSITYYRVNSGKKTAH